MYRSNTQYLRRGGISRLKRGGGGGGEGVLSYQERQEQSESDHAFAVQLQAKEDAAALAERLQTEEFASVEQKAEPAYAGPMARHDPDPDPGYVEESKHYPVDDPSSSTYEEVLSEEPEIEEELILSKERSSRAPLSARARRSQQPSSPKEIATRKKQEDEMRKLRAEQKTLESRLTAAERAARNASKPLDSSPTVVRYNYLLGLPRYRSYNPYSDEVLRYALNIFPSSLDPYVDIYLSDIRELLDSYQYESVYALKERVRRALNQIKNRYPTRAVARPRAAAARPRAAAAKPRAAAARPRTGPTKAEIAAARKFTAQKKKEIEKKKKASEKKKKEAEVKKLATSMAKKMLSDKLKAEKAKAKAKAKTKANANAKTKANPTK